MNLIRILVLCVTFFMVALCPSVDCALCVFALGTAIYLLLWIIELFMHWYRKR